VKYKEVLAKDEQYNGGLVLQTEELDRKAIAECFLRVHKLKGEAELESWQLE
jgi:hypothetical protein